MKLKTFINKQLQDPLFRAEYEKADLEFEMAKILIDARIFMGFTQKQLARAIKTKQSSIARLESGNRLPSMGLLKKISQAYKTPLVLPLFGFMDTTKYMAYIQETKNDQKRSIFPYVFSRACLALGAKAKK